MYLLKLTVPPWPFLKLKTLYTYHLSDSLYWAKSKRLHNYWKQNQKWSQKTQHIPWIYMYFWRVIRLGKATLFTLQMAGLLQSVFILLFIFISELPACDCPIISGLLIWSEPKSWATGSLVWLLVKSFQEVWGSCFYSGQAKHGRNKKDRLSRKQWHDSNCAWKALELWPGRVMYKTPVASVCWKLYRGRTGGRQLFVWRLALCGTSVDLWIYS